METKHTPGPWYFKPTSGGQGLIISEATGANVAVAYDVKDGPTLAAAPDLLAALEALLPLAANFNAATGVWNVQLDKARAALAKAKQ